MPLRLLTFVLALTSWSSATVSMAQSEGISPTYSFSIRKNVEPPIIDIVPGTLRFEDADGNNAINANETCAIVFELKNTGTGDGLNLKAKLGGTGSTVGITTAPLQPIENLPKGGARAYRLPVTAGMGTADGEMEFYLEVEEPNGSNSPPVTLVVATRKFAAPMVQVVDHMIVSTDGASTLALRKPYTLQVLDFFMITGSKLPFRSRGGFTGTGPKAVRRVLSVWPLRLFPSPASDPMWVAISPSKAALSKRPIIPFNTPSGPIKPLPAFKPAMASCLKVG